MIEDKQEFTGPVDREARLVVFVARKVMGWMTSSDWIIASSGGMKLDAQVFEEGVWNPLTNDAHAGHVLDRMAVKGFDFNQSLDGIKPRRYEVDIYDGVKSGNAIVEVQGNPPTEADFKTARLRSQVEAAAKAFGWEG